MDVKVRNAFRSGNLIGIPVKSPDQQSLGVIEEFVVDILSGRVVYAVLGFEGFFGFGEKFFAVPWEEFSLIHDETEMYFVIDTSREKLKQLQGFDKSDWPDVANSDWDRLITIGDEQSGDRDESDHDNA